MNTHADKTQGNRSQAAANTIALKQGEGDSTFQFVDNRLETIVQRKLNAMANNSSNSAFQKTTNWSVQIASPIVQRQVDFDLKPGTDVWDENGTPGKIIEFIFDPRNPRYMVGFIGEYREVGTNDLFLENPDINESGSEESENEDDSAELLSRQHKQQKKLVKKANAIINSRSGKIQENPGERKSLSKKGKGFLSRFKKEIIVDPSGVTKKGKHYSKKGALIGAHEKITAIGDATINQPLATPIEGVINSAVGAMVGTNRREGRTPGNIAKVEEKAGQVISALGSILQAIPVIGAAAGPLSGAGTFLQEHAGGASKKQAGARALAATASSSLAGAIPGYGTYSGMVGLINDCRKLVSTVERHGDPEYAHKLLAQVDQLISLQKEIEENGLDSAKTNKLIKNIHHQITKLNSRYVTEMRRRTKQDRGVEGAKTSLLEESRFGSFDPDENESEDSSDF